MKLFRNHLGDLDKKPCSACCDQESSSFVMPGYYHGAGLSSKAVFPICPFCFGTGLEGVVPEKAVGPNFQILNYREQKRREQDNLLKKGIIGESEVVVGILEKFIKESSAPVLPVEVLVIFRGLEFWRTVGSPSGVYIQRLSQEIPLLLDFLPKIKNPEFVFPEIISEIDESILRRGMTIESLADWLDATVSVGDFNEIISGYRRSIPEIAFHVDFYHQFFGFNQLMMTFFLKERGHFIINPGGIEIAISDGTSLEEVEFLRLYFRLVDFLEGRIDEQTGLRKEHKNKTFKIPSALLFGYNPFFPGDFSGEKGEIINRSFLDPSEIVIDLGIIYQRENIDKFKNWKMFFIETLNSEGIPLEGLKNIPVSRLAYLCQKTWGKMQELECGLVSPDESAITFN